ncbi:hypothetical protein [Actinomadura rayongensis]|uniref:Uncharacterized protein n=1 Tax=Actinomadura rayongensis TaxID=1429076 RepID=A0A6I4W9E6_9ACTN|nr:hypothetical protein [Actinomadura rayongensis]MXQ64895.1 hypothetical protein [Actinomadura rayongensis]
MPLHQAKAEPFETPGHPVRVPEPMRAGRWIPTDLRAAEPVDGTRA